MNVLGHRFLITPEVSVNGAGAVNKLNLLEAKEQNVNKEVNRFEEITVLILFFILKIIEDFSSVAHFLRHKE